MKFCSKVSISVLAIQLQQYHMSFINYISLGNTNMNIIRCKMHCLIVTFSKLRINCLLLIIHICSAMEIYPAAFNVWSPKREWFYEWKLENEGLGFLFALFWNLIQQQWSAAAAACLTMDVIVVQHLGEAVEYFNTFLFWVFNHKPARNVSNKLPGLSQLQSRGCVEFEPLNKYTYLLSFQEFGNNLFIRLCCCWKHRSPDHCCCWESCTLCLTLNVEERQLWRGLGF